jgi:hypothetical protein
MFRLAILAQTVLSLLILTPAFAADEPTADALIQHALDLRRDGRAEEALKLFQRAHAILPSARTFGQMGLVETSLKRWVDADMHLSVSLTSPDDPWVVKNRAFLEQALDTSKQHIGDLVVSGPAGTEVFVAGKSVGTLPTVPPEHLIEGAVSVSATAPGFKPFDQTVVIRPGIRTPITIAFSPIATEPMPTLATTAPVAGASLSTAATAPASNRSSWHTWAGASLAIAGASLLTWGAVWIAINNHDACGSTQGAACGTAYSTRTPGWILAGVGTAAIAGGAVIFFTGRESSASNVALGIGTTSINLRGTF